MPWNDRTKRRLKLRDLDILMAVIETGSMGKAANRLDDLTAGRLQGDRRARGRARRSAARPQPARRRADGLRRGARQARRRDLQRPAARRTGHRLSLRSNQGRDPYRVRPIRVVRRRHLAGDRSAVAQVSGHDLSTSSPAIRRRSTAMCSNATSNSRFAAMIGRMPEELTGEVILHDVARGDDGCEESADAAAQARRSPNWWTSRGRCSRPTVSSASVVAECVSGQRL